MQSNWTPCGNRLQPLCAHKRTWINPRSGFPTCGAPTTLLFAVAAVVHAAPPPTMAFAQVDKVDIAIRSPALLESAAIDADQQIFDGKRAGVQGNFDGHRTRPAVERKTPRGWCHENADGARRPDSGRNGIQVASRYRFVLVDRRQYIEEMFPQLSRAPSNARGRKPGASPQRPRQPRLDQPCQLSEAHKVPIGGQVLDRPVEGPLVQRIDEIQGWMSPAPLEGIGALTHIRPCPACTRHSIITYTLRLYGYARLTARECV